MQVVDANGNMFGYDSITVAGPDGRPKTLSSAIKLITLVRNTSGSTMTKGTVVYINGGSGNKPTIARALATSDATSAQTYGVVQSNIPNNKNGYVVVIGALEGVNTSSYAPGTQLYLSSTVAGEWTSTKQLAPAHLVYVGIVVRQHVNQGVVEVKIQNGYELDEIHDVSITTPLNDQVLQYESSTQLWKNKTLATGITIGSTSITSGTVGRVLFEGAGNVVQESANITWDNTNLLFALGSTATRIFNFRPEDTTGAYGNSCSIRGGNGNGRLDFYSASNITEVRDNIILLTSVTGPSVQVGTGSINLNVASSTRLQVAPTTGNVLIGTTTDAGYKLDVNGTARLNNNLILTNSSFTGTMSIRVTANNTITFGNSGIGDWLQAGSTNRVFILQELNSTARGNVLGNNIGTIAVNISTLSPQSSGTSNLTGLQLTYAINNTGTYSGIARGIFYNPTLTSLTGTIHRAIETVTGDVLFCTTSGNVGIGTASPTNKLDISFIPNRLISFTQRPGYADYGRIIFSNVTGADIASSGNISLIPGDANEIISFGSFLTRSAFTASSNYGTYSPTGVGFQVGSNKPFVFRNTSADINTDFFVFEAPNTGARRLFNIIQNSVSYLTVFPTGNVTIGTTTDAGFKFDVNGTARINGSANSVISTILNGAATNNVTALIRQTAIGGSSDAKPIGLQIDIQGATDNDNIIYGRYWNSGTPTESFYVSRNGNMFLSGRVGIGVSLTAGVYSSLMNINASAQFQIDSTTRGFLPPRMTTTQKNAIATPATGLQVYDTTLNQMSYYNGTTWTNI